MPSSPRFPQLRGVGATAALATVLFGVSTAPAAADVDASVTSSRSLRVASDDAGDTFTIRLNPLNPTSILVETPTELLLNVRRDDISNIVVDAGGGDDDITVVGSEVFTITDPITVNAGSGNDTFTGGGGRETVLSGPDADELHGNGGDDLLIGEAGDDVIVGGAGADVVTGAGDADTFEWEPGDGIDTIGGGTGTDTLHVTGTVETERFVVAAVGDTVRLEHQAQTGPELKELERVDLEARGGDDHVAASGTLPESLILELHGQSGGDLLIGGAASDELDGGDGPDVLNGGDGADFLRGGADQDRFECDPLDTLFDLEPFEAAEGTCGPAAPPQQGDDPTSPGPELPGQPQAPVSGGPGDAGAPAATLPRGFLGFARPKVRLTRTGLRVVVRNTHSAPITVTVAATEKRGRKRFSYRRVRKTIAAGRGTTIVLKAPRALLRARGTRKPAVTVANAATGGKISARR